MVRVAITFFILAIIAYIVGATGIAGVSLEIGKIFLVAFLFISIITFLISLITGKSGRHMP